MEFPNSKISPMSSDTWKSINPWSVVTRYDAGRQGPITAGFRKYLIRELSKVDGGMNGICLNPVTPTEGK